MLTACYESSQKNFEAVSHLKYANVTIDEPSFSKDFLIKSRLSCEYGNSVFPLWTLSKSERTGKFNAF